MDETVYVSRGMKRKLYEAAKSGNVQVLNEIGELQGVANEVTPGGNTALHIAAYHGSLYFIQKLLQLSNADPEHGMAFLKAKNMEGNTALHEAALGGHEGVVDVLLESGDLVNEINEAGETALFKACEGGHVKIVEKLCPLTLEVHYKRFDGQTPLHLAVSKLSIGVIKKLLDDRPVLATQVDNFHRTPLHMAALIPPPSMNSKQIRLMGDMLIREDNLSCYKVDQNRQSALHVAAKEGNAPLVKVILNYSSDCLEMVDNDGRNALHLAVKNAPQILERVGRFDLRTIISSVMSERLINCFDKHGQTALDIALENVDEDPQLYTSIIYYLRKFGATRKILDTGSTTISLVKARKSTWRTELISVSAVLIATVGFAVAFTLPGGLESQGQGPPTPILINTDLFKALVIFDTIALRFSIASAFLLPYAHLGSHVEDPTMAVLSLNALWVAAISLSLTFGAAIHLVVAPKCLWLAVLVWFMVGLLPIWIRIYSLRGKLYLFYPKEDIIKVLLNTFSWNIAMDIVAPLEFIVIVLFSSCLPLSRWGRKKLGIKSSKPDMQDPILCSWWF